MLISPIYNHIMDLIHYIYSDGFFSITAITFNSFILFMYYELSKDWYSCYSVENGYVNKDYEQNYKIKESEKKQLELEEENNKENIKEEQEQLQLYKIFKSQK